MDGNGQMNKKTLQQQYRKLLGDLDRITGTPDVSKSLTVAVFSKERVKIFLIAYTRSKEISILVEVTPTAPIHSEDSNSANDEDKGLNGYLRQVLDNQITLLNYLGKLNDEGFTLGVIGEEGIWYASKVLETDPTEGISQLITPPGNTGVKKSNETIIIKEF